MVIDILMTVVSVILMGGTMLFPDDRVHQICGMVLFGLWIVHTVLNRRWYASLFRGRYMSFRIMQTVVNLGIAVCAILLMISGMSMAWFMPTGFGLSYARIIHLISSHWYYLLMAAHLGMHISQIAARMRLNELGKVPTVIIRIIVLIICCYGIYAFIIRGVWKYMFGIQQFFFLDLDRGYILFAVDYLAILILVATLVHWVRKVTAA